MHFLGLALLCASIAYHKNLSQSDNIALAALGFALYTHGKNTKENLYVDIPFIW